MIDIFAEQVCSFAEATKMLPGRPHCGTIARWAAKGRNGVRLETVVVGGRRFTSLEAIKRFIARLSDEAPADTGGRAAARSRRDEQVERQLEAEGL